MRGLRASDYLTLNIKIITKRGLLFKDILIYKFNFEKKLLKSVESNL